MVDLLSTGIPGMDQVLGGGVPYGYSWLIEGENGIGKTTVGLQFVHAIVNQPDERALYVSFVELPQELYRFASNFGWDFHALERAGRLRMLGTSPKVFLEELLGDSGSFRTAVEEFMPTRLVIDSITDLRLYADATSGFRMMMEALLNFFRRRQVTTLLIEDTGPEIPASGLVRRIADINMIMSWRRIPDEGMLDRIIRIPKVRGQSHFNVDLLFEIGTRGALVIPPDYDTSSGQPVEAPGPLPPSGYTNYFSTGLPALDHLVGGGMPYGSNWLFAYDDASYYPGPHVPMLVQAYFDGAAQFLLPSGRYTYRDMQQLVSPFNVNLSDVIKEQRLFFGDLFGRPDPDGLAEAMIRAESEESAEQYATRLADLLSQLGAGNRPLLATIFVNSLIRRFDSSGFKRFVDVLIAVSPSHTTHMFLANSDEIRLEDRGFLSFYCQGYVTFRKMNGYQYLQVVKTPRFTSSPPCIMVQSSKFPFYDLIIRR